MFNAKPLNITLVKKNIEDKVLFYNKSIVNLINKLICNEKSEDQDFILNEEISNVINLYKNTEYRSFIFGQMAQIFDSNKKKITILSSLFYLLYIYDLIQDYDHDNLYKNDDIIFINNNIDKTKISIVSHSIINLVFEIISNEVLKISNEKKCKIIQTFSKQIGRFGMLNGHFISFINRNKSTDENIRMRIGKLKIGSLFEIINETIQTIYDVNENQMIALKSYNNNVTSLLKFNIDIENACNHNVLFYTNIKNNIDLLIQKSKLLKDQAIQIISDAFQKAQVEGLIEVIEFIYKQIENKYHIIVNE